MQAPMHLALPSFTQPPLARRSGQDSTMNGTSLTKKHSKCIHFAHLSKAVRCWPV